MHHPTRFPFLLIALLFLFQAIMANVVPGNFLSDKGTKLTHPFIDQQDSLSSNEIIELKGVDGFPVWFGRSFRKIVCLTGECKIANVWLFWDGAGDYLGYQLYDNEALTKNDHVPFVAAEYTKLDNLLRDSISFLKETPQEELVLYDEVDGYSGATQTEYVEQLIEGAAYTCYTLWHTVYGNTQDKVREIMSLRIDSAYVGRLFASNNQLYRKWAVQFLIKQPQFAHSFDTQVIELIADKDEKLALQGLEVLNQDMLESNQVRQKLFDLFPSIDSMRKFRICIRLSEMDHLDDSVVLFLLKQFENKKINTSSLQYIYKNISKSQLKNKEINAVLTKLLKYDNYFISDITKQLFNRLDT